MGKRTVSRRLFLAVVLAATFGLLGGAAVRGEINGSLCAACHEMRPEYLTWQVSPHAKTPCVACHQEYSLGYGLVRKFGLSSLSYYRPVLPERKKGFHAVLSEFLAKRKIVSALWSHVTAAVTRKEARAEVQPARRLDDGPCRQCHSLNLSPYRKGDLIVPHERHAEKKVSCFACHAAVAHGGVSRPAGKAVQAAAAKLPVSVEEARQLVLPQATTAPMDTCMGCHRRRKVTLECQACHTQTKMPESHRKPDFALRHGAAARENLGYCDECHKYTRDQPQAAIPRDAGEYARGNPFCSSCHANMPPSHLRPDWGESHGRGSEAAKCGTCHGLFPGQEGPAAKTNCSSCHDQAKAHWQGWRLRHPVEVGGKVGRQCFTCHGEETCTRCHRVAA